MRPSGHVRRVEHKAVLRWIVASFNRMDHGKSEPLPVQLYRWRCGRSRSNRGRRSSQLSGHPICRRSAVEVVHVGAVESEIAARQDDGVGGVDPAAHHGLQVSVGGIRGGRGQAAVKTRSWPSQSITSGHPLTSEVKRLSRRARVGLA